MRGRAMFKSFMTRSCLILSIAGCATRNDLQVFDFGPVPRPDAKTSLGVAVADVVAPRWLDGTELKYRLSWQERQSMQPYAGSRWADTPAMMLTQRLRQMFNSTADRAASARCDLQVTLDEFGQVLNSESASRAVLQAHATLRIRGEHETQMSRSWHVEQRAESTDASSSAAALGTATREFAQSVRNWVQPHCTL